MVWVVNPTGVDFTLDNYRRCPMGVMTATGLTAMAVGNKRLVTADVLGSASYATGGDTITPASLGLTQKIDFITAESNDSVADNRLFQLIAQADGSFKMVLNTAVNTEVANATNVSTIGFRVMALGY